MSQICFPLLWMCTNVFVSSSEWLKHETACKWRYNHFLSSVAHTYIYVCMVVVFFKFIYSMSLVRSRNSFIDMCVLSSVGLELEQIHAVKNCNKNGVERMTEVQDIRLKNYRWIAALAIDFHCRWLNLLLSVRGGGMSREENSKTTSTTVLGKECQLKVKNNVSTTWMGERREEEKKEKGKEIILVWLPSWRRCQEMLRLCLQLGLGDGSVQLTPWGEGYPYPNPNPTLFKHLVKLINLQIRVVSK